MHDSYEIINYLTKYKINFVFVPKGLTSILQPLDISINHPFKLALKHEYEFLLTFFGKAKVPKVKREKIIEWIVNCWEDKDKIKTETIKNSFLYCGISNKPDGTEDEMFIGWKKLGNKD